jgi:hypothetical protein
MKIVNLTPHPINIVGADGTVVRTIPSSGTARCSTHRVQVGDVDGIPVNSAVFGNVSGLPDPADGTVYVVSAIVAQAVPNRADVLVPDDTVRDGAGQIVGCRAFARIN